MSVADRSLRFVTGAASVFAVIGPIGVLAYLLRAALSDHLTVRMNVVPDHAADSLTNQAIVVVTERAEITFVDLEVKTRLAIGLITTLPLAVLTLASLCVALAVRAALGGRPEGSIQWLTRLAAVLLVGGYSIWAAQFVATRFLAEQVDSVAASAPSDPFWPILWSVLAASIAGLVRLLRGSSNTSSVQSSEDEALLSRSKP